MTNGQINRAFGNEYLAIESSFDDDHGISGEISKVDEGKTEELFAYQSAYRAMSPVRMRAAMLSRMP
jgi:hypothetical protein